MQLLPPGGVVCKTGSHDPASWRHALRMPLHTPTPLCRLSPSPRPRPQLSLELPGRGFMRLAGSPKEYACASEGEENAAL